MSASEVKVRVRNLSKLYKRVHEKPMLLREALLFLAGRDKRVDDHWALKDISFEIHAGETMGVLGANGSGKSTLLQIVSGTAYPTEGSVSSRGRVSTLLELGAGFNGDMTGEENILVNAGLIGLSLEEARRRMPKIIEFAELEDAIDTPVKYYSSGMTARLGFAIAINVSPKIVVIDEVLSVGDMAFQKKSMEEILRIKRSGTTILYASQSPSTIAEFCTRAIWLDQGHVRMIGPAHEVGSEYMLAMQKKQQSQMS